MPLSNSALKKTFGDMFCGLKRTNNYVIVVKIMKSEASTARAVARKGGGETLR